MYNALRMSDAVQQIKDRLNIIDVVGKYVELHQAGRHFKGKSPFTSERTPSFYVSPDRGMYYCFSTNQGGDIFTFMQAMEGVDFKEALRLLAEQANVELVPEAPEKRSARERAYQVLEAATVFYEQKLAAQPEAQAYLEQRSVHEQTRRSWRIGYAPGPPLGGWRELRQELSSKGFTDQEMLATGLIKQPEKGKDPFDVFRDRIVFPVYDSQGRVVAFSGRILHPNDKAPKYVNSPETELYKKSELLFGYDRAKQGVRKLPFWIIAEGQFDVIMSHQAGYTNTVAVSGTALTVAHVRQLERLCPRVVLALDADRAGIAAMQKAATVMLARGLDVKVAPLPEGSDPADLVAADVQQYKHLIGKSMHIIEFLLQYLRTTTPDERTYKLRVREELLPFIVLIPNEIDQEHFVGVVAEQTNTTLEAIRHEVQRLRDRQAPAEHTEDTVEDAVPAPTNAENGTVSRRAELIAYLVAAYDVVPSAWQDKLVSLLTTVCHADWQSLVEAVPVTKRSEYTFLLERDFHSYNERVQAEELADRLNQLYTTVTTEQIAGARTRLSVAEQAEDEASVAGILDELRTLQEARLRVACDGQDFINLSSLD